MRQTGLFGLSEHLKRLSANGDPLEELGRIIDFEAFRPALVAGLAYGDGSKGGRPPYDPVAMLKVLILAAQNNVADARMEYLIRDRLSWLRFLGFDLGAATPDANTIPMFRVSPDLPRTTGSHGVGAPKMRGNRQKAAEMRSNRGVDGAAQLTRDRYSIAGTPALKAPNWASYESTTYGIPSPAMPR